MELEQQISTQPAYGEVGPFTKLWTFVLSGARLLDQKIEGVMETVILLFILLILLSPILIAIYFFVKAIMVIAEILGYIVRRIK